METRRQGTLRRRPAMQTGFYSPLQGCDLQDPGCTARVPPPPVPDVINSEVLIIIPNGHVLCLLQLPLMLRDERRVNLDLRGLGELADELQVPLVGEAAGKPQEGLLEVVVAPRAEVVVLEVALPVELDVLGLDLAVLVGEAA